MLHAFAAPGLPHIRQLPAATSALRTLARTQSFGLHTKKEHLASAAALLHTAAWLQRAGEPITPVIVSAERLVLRWVRRHRLRLARRTAWLVLIGQPLWPVLGLLHLIWDTLRQHSHVD